MTVLPVAPPEALLDAVEEAGARVELDRGAFEPDPAVAPVLEKCCNARGLTAWQVIGPELVLDATPLDDYLQWEVTVLAAPQVRFSITQHRGQRASVADVDVDVLPSPRAADIARVRKLLATVENVAVGLWLARGSDV